MNIYLKRTLTGLEAADDLAVSALRRVKIGKTVRAAITTPRNLQHHKKFFALINLVWAATGTWESADDLMIELKVQLGIVSDVLVRATGEIVKIVGSISFANMDQDAFDQFYEKALKALCEMAGGIESDGLRQEVLNQLAAA